MTAQIKYERTDIVLNKLLLSGIDQDSTNKNAVRLIHIWDSLYPKHKSVVYNMLPGVIWERILYSQYKIAQKNKKTSLQLQLAFPLATIYHVQAKSEAIPILELLYNNRTKLSREKDSMVLIKLEEQYRNRKDFAKAIVIRNQRIEKKYIATFWELYKEAGMYQAALNDYLLFEPIPNAGTIEKIKYYNALGQLYFEMNQTSKSIANYQLGLQECDLILSRRKDLMTRDYDLSHFYKPVLNGNIGMCMMKEGDYEKALLLLKYDFNNSNLDIDNKIRKAIAIGECYLMKKQYAVVQQYMDTAKLYLVGKDNKQMWLQYYLLNSNLYKAKGLINQSFFYLNKYSNLRDTFSVLMQQQQATLLLTNLEIEKRRKNLLQTNLALSNKTRESINQKAQLKLLFISLFAIIIIAILIFWLYLVKVKSNLADKQQNKQLKEFSTKIQFQNERNEILLKELHHRVKNNLQLMYSLFGMQRRRYDSTILEETMSNMQTRIQSMAYMHDKLYVSDDREIIDIKAYLEELIKHIETIFKKDEVVIDAHLLIDVQFFSFDKAISLGLILNEIISNAYKYAFVTLKRGVLKISIYEDGLNNCIIEVQDNGPGFDLNRVNTGLGFKIIKTLVAQMDGIYQIHSEDGVLYRIEFKINENEKKGI
jgi:two-component sensor histidine kinase